MEFFNSLYWDIGSMLEKPSPKHIFFLRTNNIDCIYTKFTDNVDPIVEELIHMQELAAPLPMKLWNKPIKKSVDDVILIAGPDHYTERVVDECLIAIPNLKYSYTIPFKGETFGDLILSIHDFLLSKSLPNNKLDQFYMDLMMRNFRYNVEANKIMYGLKQTPDNIFDKTSTMLQTKFDKGHLLMCNLLLPPYHRLRGFNRFFYESGKWITQFVYEY